MVQNRESTMTTRDSFEARSVQKAKARLLSAFIALMSAAATMAGSADELSAPVAKKIPKVLEEHGHRRDDPYFWIKERENPAVIEYLKKENDYLNRTLTHTTNLQATLFEEIVGRIKKDDDTVPVRIKDY